MTERRTDLDVEWARAQFPALAADAGGRRAIFLDAPGGTQVPSRVLDAVRDYRVHANANTHGAFATSERTDETIMRARRAAADLLGCDAGEVAFGANMTTLAFALGRALGRDLSPGDEV